MFKQEIFFLALACLGLAEGGPSANHTHWSRRKLDEDDKVLGGVDAKLGEIPYQVSVVYQAPCGYYSCGGEILTEKVVLTAAHCVMNPAANSWKNYTITAGAISLKNPGPQAQVSTVKTGVVHPKYNIEGHHQGQPYDIGILILDKPFTFNEYVQPVALPEPGATFTGNATVSGWGRTSNITEAPVWPDILQKVELPLIDFEQCKEKYHDSSLDEFSNICTGSFAGNTSACKGDSGGPLTMNLSGTTTVIGIVSWGYLACGLGNPAVYTRVSSFIDFIEDTIKKFD